MTNVIPLFPEHPVSHPSRGLSGVWWLRDGMVFVRSEHGMKPTQIGGSVGAEETLARIMLRELADEAAVAKGITDAPPKAVRDLLGAVQSSLRNHMAGTRVA